MANDGIEALEKILGHLENPEAYRSTPARDQIPERAHALFRNFRHEAFPVLTAKMQAAECLAKGSGRAPRRGRVVAEEAVELAIEGAKRTVRPLFRDRFLSAKHAKAAFYGFDRRKIAERLATIERVVGRRMEFTHHSPNLIELRAARRAEVYVPVKVESVLDSPRPTDADAWPSQAQGAAASLGSDPP